MGHHCLYLFWRSLDFLNDFPDKMKVLACKWVVEVYAHLVIDCQDETRKLLPICIL